MALTTTVTGLVLVLEDVDLDATMVIHDLGGDLHFAQCCLVGGDGGAIDYQDGREFQRRARLTGNPIYDEDVADLDLLLASASSNDRVHVGTPVVKAKLWVPPARAGAHGARGERLRHARAGLLPRPLLPG